jgi:phosphatidylglycerophosphate synthase
MKINRWTADVLSALRFGCAFATGILIVAGLPVAAVIVFGFAVITDPLEGVMVRKVPEKTQSDHSDKWMSNTASGALLAIVPGAIVVRFFLAHMLGWSDANTVLMWVGLAGCVLFGIIVGRQNLAKMYLWPEMARRADIHQGWLYFFVLFCCAIQLFATAFGTNGHAWTIAGIFALAVEMVSLAAMADRPYSLEHYHGRRTRKEMYTCQS